MENINEHSFLNTKHKLSFSQYGNSFEQLKYKAKKIIKNVNFLNSNISLLGDIQQQINHSHCVQKSLNKISKNSITTKNTYFYFKLRFSSLSLKNKKTLIYLPVTSLQYVKNDLYYFQTSHCFYLINLTTGDLQSAQLIFRKLFNLIIYPIIGIILNGKKIIFSLSNNYILVYNIEDSSSYTKLRFNKYRQYYGFNYNKCLITDQIEIVRIDNHCNPHILYEDCEYSCYTSHRNEIIIEDNWTCRGRQLKYYLYNLSKKME